MATKSSDSKAERTYRIRLPVKTAAFIAVCACLCYFVSAGISLAMSPVFDTAISGILAILSPEAYSEYAHLTGYALETFRPFVIALGVALLCIFFLTLTTGRRKGSPELYMSRLDSIYSDVLFALFAGFIAACASMNILIVDNYYIDPSSPALPFFCAAVTAISAPCALAIWLSIVRKIKAGKLLRHSLIFSTLHGVYRLIRGTLRAIGRFFSELFSGRRFEGYTLARALFVRQTVFISASALIVAGFMLSVLADAFWIALMWVVAEICILYYYVKANNSTFENFEKINVQIYHIQDGNMSFDPDVRGDSQIREMSQRLLGIGSGMQVAIDSRLASERMKIALVTNVSHDLKTPLTSIIGYIDLLRRDETLSGEARDYVTILAQKSQRLKTIIEDLFDLAKTTSGDQGALDIDYLDLRRLIEQTLADMDDKITQSGQLVRTKLPQTPVIVRADGRRLYRVIQNIIDNALKYSMPGTRIYISLLTDGKSARVMFKNTASYEMNFTADEIIERFVRGDKSRSTEGSGLGLSIAAGFTSAMQGEFHVDVDGDQFTVEFIFALAEQAAEPDISDPAPETEPEPNYRSRALNALRGKLYRPQKGVAPKPVILRDIDPAENAREEKKRMIFSIDLPNLRIDIPHFKSFTADTDATPPREDCVDERAAGGDSEPDA